MSNPENDSRLEQLSREAADRYTVQASPSWDKMERELDKVLPTKEKKRRRFLFWWIIPFVLIGGSILWYSSSTSLKKNTSRSDDPTTLEVDPIITATDTPMLTKEATTSIEPATPGIKKEQKLGINKPTITVASQKKTTKKSNALFTTQQQTSINEKVSATPSRKENDQTMRGTVYEATTSNAINTTPANSTLIRPTVDTGSNSSNNGISEKKDTMATTAITTPTSPTMDKKDTIVSNKKTKSTFSIALLLGLDATTVKFKYADKANATAGIVVGYHWNNNWSIHTGALYTRKNYKMAGTDFKAPAGTWVANYTMKTVDGFCNMWELPLVTRYTFNSKTKTRAFVSTGLSSYLMTRENYNYYYYYNNIPVRRNVNYPNGKTHMFSILKISGGWIRETGKYGSMIIEPFANLPLRGLGFGSARLSSFGVNFSYQFKQPSKKN